MKCPFCGAENIEGNDLCESCNEDLTAFDGVHPQDDLENSLLKDTVSSVAQCEPVIVSSNTPIQKMAEGLHQHENTCGIIMDGDQLVGIVTVRDILQKAMFKDIDLNTTPISKIMTPNPEVLRPEDELVHALTKMAIGGYRHVPIVDSSKVTSIISVRDVLGYLAEMFPETAAA